MNNVQCKNCAMMIYGWCEPTYDSRDLELNRDCEYFKQKTNMSHIKSLNYEDLAKYLVKIGWSCVNCSEDERLVGSNIPCDEQCELHCQEWLSKEIK